MRRALLLASSLAIIAGTATAQEQITLQFWDNQQTESGLSEYQRAAVERFEAENPDINVEITTIPYPEYQQRLLTAVQGGNAPDIATLDQIWMGAFAESGSILPLGDLAADAGVEAGTFFPGAWESANYDGTLWGIPFNVDVWFFGFYNQDLFEEAGVDAQSAATWEGLKEAAAKLTGDGQFGIGLFGGRGEDTVVALDSFIFSNGGRVLNEDGSCALGEPAAVEAMEYVASLVPYAPAGILNASSGSMRELFLNGSLAIELWPALEQPTLQSSDLDWEFIVGFAPEGKTPVGAYGGWNLAIFESSAHQEAAWKFIQFMTREDVNGDVVDLIPANVAAAEAFLEENRVGPDRIMEHLNNAAPRPVSPRYLEISNIQVDMFQSLFQGTDAQEVADTACTAIDALN